MISYTVLERDGGRKTYECKLCGASSPDLDAARAHHAAHVAGPELLEVGKTFRDLDKIGYAKPGRPGDSYNIAMQRLHAVLAKAEPKG
jgi:hypothetical protein